MDSARGSFGDPGITACLSAPPGLSQTATPFIASWRRGIPHTPLVAWPHGCQALHLGQATPTAGDSQAWAIPRPAGAKPPNSSGVLRDPSHCDPSGRTDAPRDPAPPTVPQALKAGRNPPTALRGARRVATTCTPATDASSTQTQLSKTDFYRSLPPDCSSEGLVKLIVFLRPVKRYPKFLA